MSANAQTIIQWLESFAPKHLAVEGDKIGLQIGTLEQQVQTAMVTVDVTEKVVEEAINKNVNLIIAHHPVIFKPLAHVRTDLPQGRLLQKLLTHNIAVYVAHTNLDIATGGINDWLADKLELKSTEILSTTYVEPLKKLAAFVPIENEAEVREALGNSGAGWIGNYSHCTFRSGGTGTFLPREGTDPHIGAQGKLEQVEELRIETIFPERLEKKVLQALYRSHPYEEVAYDIYPLDQKGEAFGLGRVGQLQHEMTLKEFGEHVKRTLDLPGCRVVGPADAKVKKVAVLGGDGNKYIHTARLKGADVLVTGDVYYHTAQDAYAQGLYLVDPGHYMEKVMMEGLQQVLQQAAADHRSQVEVIISRESTDIFTFL